MIKVNLKRILKIIVVFLLIVICILAAIILNFFRNVKQYSANDEEGFHSPYYTYISPRVVSKAEKGEKISILVLPNNSAGTSDNFNVHQRFALLQTFIGHLLFKELDSVILVPIFPRSEKEWQVYSHALDRDSMTTEVKEMRRTDLQLNKMIDETSKRLSEKWNINDKVLMWGHSASGMFVNRYTLLHPQRVMASVIYSPGGWPIAPVEEYDDKELRYPIGINDIKELTGISIDLDSYVKIPHLFIIGSEDTNDSVPYSDSYDEEDRILINQLFGTTPLERWGKSEKIYKKVLHDVEFKTYKGMGHAPSLKSLRDVLGFFKTKMLVE